MSEEKSKDKTLSKVLGLLLIVLLFVALNYLKYVVIVAVLAGVGYWAYSKNKANTSADSDALPSKNSQEQDESATKDD